MADKSRAMRLSKRIGQIVATYLEHEIKDPNLDFVTVTDVRLTGDLRDATVFYTVIQSDLASEPDYPLVQQSLDKAKGQLRSAVGVATGLKHTPSLKFQLDNLPQSASTLESALSSARLRDAEIARISEGARYAGEENPYQS